MFSQLQSNEPICSISPYGTKRWKLNDQLHRLDGPAIVFISGEKSWHQNGKLHRLDGPAVEYATGTKEWYQNGLIHRMDGPACEWANGSIDWYIHGECQYTTLLELSVGQSIPWYYDDSIALVIKQINHTLFQILIGNKKEYVFSTSKQ